VVDAGEVLLAEDFGMVGKPGANAQKIKGKPGKPPFYHRVNSKRKNKGCQSDRFVHHSMPRATTLQNPKSGVCSKLLTLRIPTGRS
jgi:hypothetical protein